MTYVVLRHGREESREHWSEFLSENGSDRSHEITSCADEGSIVLRLLSRGDTLHIVVVVDLTWGGPLKDLNEMVDERLDI